MRFLQRQFLWGLGCLKLAVTGVLVVLLCLPSLSSYSHLKRDLSDTYLLAPFISQTNLTDADKVLSVLFDDDSMFGTVRMLSDIEPVSLVNPLVSLKVLRAFMSDFYWSRIMALALVKDYVELENGVAKETKISNLMLQINSMTNDSPIVRREMQHLLFLATGLDYDAVAKKANLIIKEEVDEFLEYVKHDLNNSDPDVLSLFLARREYAGSDIFERLGKELFNDRPYPGAQWEDFEVEQKAASSDVSFPVMHAKYNGHTRNLPATFNWQIISDVMHIRSWLRRAQTKKGQAFPVILNMLSDARFFDALVVHYQKLLDEFVAKSPTQEQIDYFLTALSTVLAFHPLNSVEKGRVGAIMVVRDAAGKLKIVGVGFDGAPINMKADREVYGREGNVDRYVPRRNQDRDKPDFRFLFILRRSPCAEKKALMQALSAMERGDIAPGDIYGATMYTSRTPCYQCVMALSQFGISGVSAGDYQLRDNPSRKVDEACGFKHVHPEMVASDASKDSILTYDFDSVSASARWARILNVLRGFAQTELRKGVLGKLGVKAPYPEREFLDKWDFNIVRHMIADYSGAVNIKELFHSSHYKNMLGRTRYPLFLNALYDYTEQIRKEIDNIAIKRQIEKSIGTAA